MTKNNIMSRPIKYRAYSKKHEKMYYGRNVEFWDFDGEVACRVYNKGDGTTFGDYDVAAIPLQYTGLNDSNEKEACYHDKIRTTVLKREYVIEWNFGMFGYYDEHQKWTPLYKLQGSFEIIGNLYEKQIVKG